MRHVPVAVFKDKVSEYIAAAENGEEIVITRHGKPTAKLSMAAQDRAKVQREAIEALSALGERIRQRNGPTPLADVIIMIHEDRR